MEDNQYFAEETAPELPAKVADAIENEATEIEATRESRRQYDGFRVESPTIKKTGLNVTTPANNYLYAVKLSKDSNARTSNEKKEVNIMVGIGVLTIVAGVAIFVTGFMILLSTQADIAAILMLIGLIVGIIGFLVLIIGVAQAASEKRAEKNKANIDGFKPSNGKK